MDEATDPRIAAVLAVLAGSPVATAARESSLDPALLHRWVRAFVEAGTAQVTHRPVGQIARQRDRFLTTFMHGMRSPLAVAQGWVGMLRDTADDPARLVEVADQLQASLALLDERALDVELLTAAMLGRLTLDAAPVTVARLSASLVLPAAVGGEGAGVQVVVDPTLFSRILRDLWTAATGTAPVPRSVRLDVETIAPWVELRIVREGAPIDPSHLQALFEPFDVEDDNVAVTVGLYLARALAVVHSGTIGVTQDDDTTTFWVRVPDRRPAPVPPLDIESTTEQRRPR